MEERVIIDEDYNIEDYTIEPIDYNSEGNEICLDGFHTTFPHYFKEIKNSGEFYCSVKDDDWLGKGVYFWADKSDGSFWARVIKDRNKRKTKGKIHDDTTVIIECKLTCEEDRYVDLDIDSEMKKIDLFAEKYQKEMEEYGRKVPVFSNDHQRKCFYCNEYKSIYNLSIMACSFPVITINSAGFPRTYQRRQICVTNNRDIDIISYTKI